MLVNTLGCHRSGDLHPIHSVTPAPSPRAAYSPISKRQIFGIAWKAGLLSDLPPLQRIMFLTGVLIGGVWLLFMRRA